MDKGNILFREIQRYRYGKSKAMHMNITMYNITLYNIYYFYKKKPGVLTIQIPWYGVSMGRDNPKELQGFVFFFENNFGGLFQDFSKNHLDFYRILIV